MAFLGSSKPIAAAAALIRFVSVLSGLLSVRCRQVRESLLAVGPQQSPELITLGDQFSNRAVLPANDMEQIIGILGIVRGLTHRSGI